MKSKTKKVYETPQLTVVSFKMERGYAESSIVPTIELDQFLLWDNSQSTQQMDPYFVHNDWNEGNNNFWN